MGIFNEHSTGNTYTRGLSGPPGVSGVGFKLTTDGNYDMENKKIN